MNFGFPALLSNPKKSETLVLRNGWKIRYYDFALLEKERNGQKTSMEGGC